MYIHIGIRAHPAFQELGAEVLSSGAKRPGHEAKYSLLYSAGVKEFVKLPSTVPYASTV
jgi:hypothetical protein